MSSKKNIKHKMPVQDREYLEITAISLPALPVTREKRPGEYEIVYPQKAVFGKELLRVIDPAEIVKWETEHGSVFDPKLTYLINSKEPDYVDHKEKMLKIYGKQGMNGVAQYVKRVKRIVTFLTRQAAS